MHAKDDVQVAAGASDLQPDRISRSGEPSLLAAASSSPQPSRVTRSATTASQHTSPLCCPDSGESVQVRSKESVQKEAILLKNLEPVTQSQTCNAWYPHRIHPLTKVSILSSPFQQRTSISSPFPLRLSLHKQDSISHITRSRYRPFYIGRVAYPQKQDHISHPTAASVLAGDFSNIFADLPVSLQIYELCIHIFASPSRHMVGRSIPP
jgi:hypothetical protein